MIPRDAKGRTRGKVLGWYSFAALLLLCLLLIPAGASGQTPIPRDFEPLRDYIEDLMREFEIPSVAVALAHRGEVLWEEGFGWADRERWMRATEHTPFSIASVTKPITATAVMLLAKQRRLELGSPANRYLAGSEIRAIGGGPSDVTVEHLLAHTGGLPLHHHFFYDGDASEPPPMHETIARYGVQITRPGEAYTYANLGYGLLDHMIETISGLSYGDFLASEIFGPLGMHGSFVGTDAASTSEAAVRYGDDGEPLPFYDFDHRGASAVYASASDLLRFGLFHLDGEVVTGGPLLPDGTRKKMRRRHTPDDGSGYGLGWSIREDDYGYLRVEHTGGMPGVSTVLRLYPEEEVVVVVLSNSANPATGRIADAITGAVLPRFIERMREAAGARNPPATLHPRSPAPIVGSWKGEIETWERPVPIRLEVAPEGEVFVRISEHDEVPVSGIQFRNGVLTGQFPGVIPTPDALTRPHLVHLHLQEQDEELVGFASALGWGEGRSHFALSSPVLLVRSPDQ